jgi:hypothetical protein
MEFVSEDLAEEFIGQPVQASVMSVDGVVELLIPIVEICGN